MNIITKEERKGRLEDGIDTVLALSEEQFNILVERLVPQKANLSDISFYYITDMCETPKREVTLGLEDDNNSRNYYGAKKLSISQIFTQMAKRLKSVPQNTEEYKRIEQLISTRDFEAFKTFYKENTNTRPEIIDMVFEILGNNSTFEKFLNYENNKQEFAIDGENVEIKEYLKCLGDFFGNKDTNGNITQLPNLNKFYIPDLESYIKRYLELIERVNIDRYIKPDYEFRKFSDFEHFTDEVIREGEEPEWEISPELYREIYDEKPDGLSLEEEAMYIYCKLCQIFSYDEGFFYRDKIDKGKYVSDFSKEHLEAIKPGTKITCWDFARIFSKLVNKIDGEIEAVIISQGATGGHYLAGFYTDKVSVMLEAINGATRGTNDLMKAKTGIKFEGIKIISDRDGLIDQAIGKVYPMITGKKQLSMDDYLQKLRSIPRANIHNSTEQKMQSFIETMRESGIFGNELVQTLRTFCDSGFFEQEIERTFLGKKEQEEGKCFYQRNVLMRINTEYQNKGKDCRLFLLDTRSLELSTWTMQEIASKIDSGELIYEDKKRTMRGIEVKEKG